MPNVEALPATPCSTGTGIASKDIARDAVLRPISSNKHSELFNKSNTGTDRDILQITPDPHSRKSTCLAATETDPKHLRPLGHNWLPGSTKA